MAIPVSLSFSINNLLYNVCKKSLKKQAMLSGYNAIQQFSNINTVVIDENTGELIIKDNGVGIDKTKKDMKHSLGCEIIKNLTKQLDGDIKYIDVENGTAYRLLFPLTMEHTISQ